MAALSPPCDGVPTPGLRVCGPQCLRPGCQPAASASQEARGVLGTQAWLPGCDAAFLPQHGGSGSGRSGHGGHRARPGFRAVITVTMTAGGHRESRTGTSEMMSPPCPQGPPRPSPQSSAKGCPQKWECLLPGALARRAGMGSLLPEAPWTPLPAHHPSPSPQAPPPGSSPRASRPALSSRHLQSRLELDSPAAVAASEAHPHTQSRGGGGGAACQLHPGLWGCHSSGLPFVRRATRPGPWGTPSHQTCPAQLPVAAGPTDPGRAGQRPRTHARLSQGPGAGAGGERFQFFMGRRVLGKTE